MLRAVLRRKPPSPAEGPSRTAPGCGAPSAPSRRRLFLRARRCRACSCHFFLWNRSQTSHSSWDRWWHRSRGCKHGKHNQGARGKTGLCFHSHEAAWLPNVSPSSSEFKTQVRSPHHSGALGTQRPALWAWPGPCSSAHHATCPVAPYLGGSEGRRPPQDLLPGHRQLQVLRLLLALPEDTFPLSRYGNCQVGWLHSAEVLHVWCSKARGALGSLGRAHLQ